MTLSGAVEQFDALAQHALGWRGLLDGLRRKLDDIDAPVEVSCVKEKFGGLRVYVTVGDGDEASHVNRWIDSAERASLLLCYQCGAGVTHRGLGHWIRYFCDEHDTTSLRDELARRHPEGR